MKHFLTLLLLISFHSIQAQCPGCIIELPTGLGEDTIWLSDIPDGTVGAYYEEDLSFRLPKTTNPINAQDPSIPAGFTIDEITIVSLSNLPPGLSWEASQTTYEPADETDGCIRLCGTPLVADTFEIDVNITAVVFGLSQNAAFSLPIVIHPAASTSEGFSMVNNIGCGSTTVSFSNNIPSQGNPGITYDWDFGNGNTTTDENPVDQTYTTPGTYYVSYEATIDTTGYILTEITVVETDCNDIWTPNNPTTAPDMHIRVTKPNGDLLFDSPVFNNTNPPISYSGSWPLEDGDYLMEVIDNDSGINGADDDCATFLFNKLSGPEISIGDFTVELTILHPVTTVSSMDTVYVFEQPAAPTITASSDVISCEVSEILLTSSYTAGNQWFQDSIPISGADDQIYVATQGGFYTVQYTSPDGCIAFSEGVEITVLPLLEIPVFNNVNNLLSVVDPDALPNPYELQWYLDGTVLPGENGLSLCIDLSGEYALILTDPATGCTSSFAQTEVYDAALNCFTATNNPLEEYKIRVSPNPTSGLFYLSLSAPQSGEMTMRILNTQGQLLLSQNEILPQGAHQTALDLSPFPKGVYLLQLESSGAVWVERIIVY